MRRFVLAIWLFSSFSGLLSCAQPERASEFTLRIAAVGPFDPLSPQLVGTYSMLIKGLVFPVLFEPSTDGRWRSQLVREWEKLGPSHYRLKLLPTIRFSDGSYVRNEQVIASLSTFGLRVSERDEWLEVQPIQAGMPIEHVLLHAVVFKDSPSGHLGTGMFAVVMQSDERILVRRVGPIRGRITEVELLSFASPRVAFASALRGEANAVLMLDPGQIELLHDVSRFRVLHDPGVHAIAAVFNARRLGRAERKAFADSIPRARAPGGTSCEMVPPVEHLRLILPGPPLDLLVMGADPIAVRTALALRRALGPRGGALEIQHVALEDRQVREGLFDILVVPLQVWPPSQAAPRWRSGVRSNFAGYSNTAVDEALDAADYSRAERELADDPPALFLCRPERTAAIDARVKNPRIGPYDMLESLPDWEVAP